MFLTPNLRLAVTELFQTNYLTVYKYFVYIFTHFNVNKNLTIIFQLTNWLILFYYLCLKSVLLCVTVLTSRWTNFFSPIYTKVFSPDKIPFPVLQRRSDTKMHISKHTQNTHPPIFFQDHDQIRICSDQWQFKHFIFLIKQKKNEIPLFNSSSNFKTIF